MILLSLRHHPKSNAPPVAAFIRHMLLIVTYFQTGADEMATATLTWTPPTTRTDGTALTPDMIAGADIFDTASTTPNTPIGSVTGAAGTFTTGVLSVGVHNFTVVTNDTTGHSSAASNVASVTVVATLANPAAETDPLNPGDEVWHALEQEVAEEEKEKLHMSHLHRPLAPEELPDISNL